jgi:hypothetical protein
MPIPSTEEMHEGRMAEAAKYIAKEVPAETPPLLVKAIRAAFLDGYRVGYMAGFDHAAATASEGLKRFMDGWNDKQDDS